MSELINLFRAEFSRTKKSLGQHFLTNAHFIKEIAAAAVVKEGEAAVEIGAGSGVLTQELYKRTENLTVIELDDNAAAFLEKHKSGFFPKIRIIHENMLNVDLNALYSDKFTVAGNLPYNAAVRILEHCTKYTERMERMVFMFQKEVASRISAHPGGKEYSSVSVFAAYHYSISKLRDISGSNFWPNANVTSTLLTFVPKRIQLLPAEEEYRFFAMVRAAFKQKRKTLCNNLKEIKILPEILSELGLSHSVRAEELSLKDFINIYSSSTLH
ncbi:MAG: 16S rRNA (adenine(1518)-N(6)/adenine(1519)-N(6))-dimethyltransferase RsmA [Deferribacteraceae bacterium]|jgi:16S rRNA (adenine1518-N6/adenine1519-N6)-dimethyltransferase|nr:16S rRNA (adenine(1518)-N(6)/adenine(1519)-N(6))-dimethyltransferase RsmA [Deferribacteraceae bacterium]